MLKSAYQIATVDDGTSSVYFSASATVSSTLFCQGTAPTALILPSSWLAGDITYQVSKLPQQSTLVPLVNSDGTPFSTTVLAGAQWIPLIPIMFNSVIYIQVTSSVAQPACTVDFALGPIYQGIHN